MRDNANYSYTYRLDTPDGKKHYIKDSEARYAITNLERTKVDINDIDDTLSDESENPIQNKAVKSYVDHQLAGLGAVLNFKGVKSSASEIKALTEATYGDVWVDSANNEQWVCIETITEAKESAWQYLGASLAIQCATLSEIEEYIGGDEN